MGPFIRFRLAHIDVFQSLVGNEFDIRESPFYSTKFASVPVFRIYGATDRGQRVVAHIHGVFPYIYVLYPGQLDPESVCTFIRRFARSLNAALHLLQKSNKDNSTTKSRCVAFIVVCKGTPFYGYHVGFKPFLKVYFTETKFKSRAAELLRSGAIMNLRFDVFEDHVSFQLQFMLDANLFGCGWVEVEHCKFRLPLPEGVDESDSVTSDITKRFYTDQTVPEIFQFEDGEPGKCSHCVLEIDLHVSSIINSRQVQPRPQHANFTELLDPSSVYRDKLVHSVRELWEDEAKRCKKLGQQAPSSQVDSTARDVWETTDSKTPRWEREPAFREQYNIRVNKDLSDYQSKKGTKMPALTTFVQESTIQKNWLDIIRTAFQVVDATWPDVIQKDGELNYPYGAWSVRGIGFDQSREPKEDTVAEEKYFDLEAVLATQAPQNDDQDPEAMQDMFFQTGFDSDDSEEEEEEEADELGDPTEEPPALEVIDDIPKTFSNSPELEFMPTLRPPSQFPLRQHTLATPSSTRRYIWNVLPPTPPELYESIESYGLPRLNYQDPYFSDVLDVPKRPREYGGRTFVLKGNSLEYIPNFEHWENNPPSRVVPTYTSCASKYWEFSQRPPSKKDISDWMVKEKHASKKDLFDRLKYTQFMRPTQSQFRPVVQPSKIAKSEDAERLHLSLLSLELLTSARPDFLPDPNEDDVKALFYCFDSENDGILSNGRAGNRFVGTVAVELPEGQLEEKLGHVGYSIQLVESELELLNTFVDFVRVLDPEIFAGFEIHNASWGYLLDRARCKYGLTLSDDLGRLYDRGYSSKASKWTENKSSSLSFSGRHTFPIWRILRSDNHFQMYSFDHLVFHVLGQRTPHFSAQTLFKWYESGVPFKLQRCFEYWRNRVELNVELLEEAEVIATNCEAARVFGVDFRSVRLRGSQFKVESVMFRIAKPESLMLISPNKDQVGKQNAAEAQPLIMEPRSGFYKGPLLVLDFQSLYPSVMIAYNYCYSTCLGRISSFKGTSKLGVTNYEPQLGLIGLLQEHTTISPNGLMFVNQNVRQSLLARMLRELLDTRVMVKNGMKKTKDKGLLRLLNGRQLALKLLANVTYGYTSATLSGRMPLVELADAIVQTGRETLEKAIQMIRGHQAWGAEVVYGDTDSLFIYLPGKTKVDAFRIGNEISNAVTASNPSPIKLKFEKVYLPCVLLAKKRYVGFKYETLDQLVPVFDAKGIETVRRDGIPAVKMLQETCLRLLFNTQDLSLVARYCQRQWMKLLRGHVSPQDFTYAKEVKLGTYSDKVSPPPGAALAARLMIKDPRSEPGYGDRVPYILVQADKGTRQVDKTVSPAEFIQHPRLRLDAEHYIERVMIPPLERIFNLIGADVHKWYNDMPKTNKQIRQTGPVHALNTRLQLKEFFSDGCQTCGMPVITESICLACQQKPQFLVVQVNTQLRQREERRAIIYKICAGCSDTTFGEPIECVSLDCSLYYTRVANEREVEAWKELASEILSEII